MRADFQAKAGRFRCRLCPPRFHNRRAKLSTAPVVLVSGLSPRLIYYRLPHLSSELALRMSEEDAVEMLSQHIITKPVSDALVEGYEFTKPGIQVLLRVLLQPIPLRCLNKNIDSIADF